MTIITKNLGLIQAIHIDVSAPTATTMLWFDVSTTPAVHKFYNTATSQWESIVKDSDNRPPANLAFDDNSNSLPLTDSTQIDGVTVLDGDRVLVIDSATAGEVSKIYLASIVTGNITWSIEQDGTGLDDPTAGDFLFVLEGAVYENSQAFFTGVAWIVGKPHAQTCADRSEALQRNRKRLLRRNPPPRTTLAAHTNRTIDRRRSRDDDRS